MPPKTSISQMKAIDGTPSSLSIQASVRSIQALVSDPATGSHQVIVETTGRIMQAMKPAITAWKIEDEVKTIRKYLELDCLVADKAEKIIGHTADILLALEGKTVARADGAGQAAGSGSGSGSGGLATPGDGLSIGLLVLRGRSADIEFEALYEVVAAALADDGKSVTREKFADQLRPKYFSANNPAGRILSRVEMKQDSSGKAVGKRYLRIRSAGL